MLHKHPHSHPPRHTTFSLISFWFFTNLTLPRQGFLHMPWPLHHSHGSFPATSTFLCPQPILQHPKPQWRSPWLFSPQRIWRKALPWFQVVQSTKKLGCHPLSSPAAVMSLFPSLGSLQPQQGAPHCILPPKSEPSLGHSQLPQERLQILLSPNKKMLIECNIRNEWLLLELAPSLRTT